MRIESMITQVKQIVPTSIRNVWREERMWNLIVRVKELTENALWMGVPGVKRETIKNW